MNDILEETKFIMKKYNIRANKSLGQNFLIDSNVIEKIIKGSDVSKNDLVIEIGPGLGTLTKFLLEKAYKVICVELDNKMIDILNDRFHLYDNFQLIHNDILKLDLNSLIEKEKQDTNIKNVKIVANLPYYITTPIIMKLLEDKVKAESLTIMTQKEVAETLGMSVRQYQRYERGDVDVKEIPFQLGVSICELLHIDIFEVVQHLDELQEDATDFNDETFLPGHLEE